ncbi:MAG: hypothetical protein HQ485_06135 [Acidobacteria bacterium]|nr:hypothetical protein [Acidobacteriota bacterium]
MRTWSGFRNVVVVVVVGFAVVGLCPTLGQAQTTVTKVVSAQAAEVAVREELDRLRREFDLLRADYGQRLADLERRLAALGSGPLLVPPVPLVPPLPDATAVPEVPAVGPVAVEPASAAPQAPAGRTNTFNPDTSVVANFVAAAGHNPFSDQPSFQLSEAELSFRSVVDPYARADLYLAASPEGLEVEEGFLTFTSLPGNWLVKMGKMRAQFGKVNTLHTHAMPTADRPLVTDNLVGGEEGISDSGVSVSRLLPNDLLFLEATGEVFAGASSVFETDQRSRLNYVGRLRGYRDLTESSNLDIGGSVAWGPTSGGEDLNRRLIGVDATFRYRPLRRAIYQRFQARTELIWSRLDLPRAPQAKAFGFYALAEYQFARRWYIGSRVDRSQRAFDAASQDSGGSVFLSFWPSEFSQLRGQYRMTKYAEGRRAHEILFQLSFGIGAHGAHVF